MKVEPGKDYRYIEAKLTDIANKFSTKKASLKGRNIITSNIVATRKYKGIIFELSYGVIFGEWCFGVTFRPDKNSKCCKTFEGVEKILREVLNVQYDKI